MSISTFSFTELIIVFLVGNYSYFGCSTGAYYFFCSFGNGGFYYIVWFLTYSYFVTYFYLFSAYCYYAYYFYYLFRIIYYIGFIYSFCLLVSFC